MLMLACTHMQTNTGARQLLQECIGLDMCALVCPCVCTCVHMCVHRCENDCGLKCAHVCLHVCTIVRTCTCVPGVAQVCDTCLLFPLLLVDTCSQMCAQLLPQRCPTSHMLFHKCVYNCAQYCTTCPNACAFLPHLPRTERKKTYVPRGLCEENLPRGLCG